MSLPLPASDECRLLPSVSVGPSPADYQQLQELLQQALRREADALRKISHLHQQLESLKSESGSARTDTPETCRWEQLDNLHDLSQTSLGSPGTPPPTLVVSGSPNIGSKSRSQPTTPLPTTSEKSGSSLFGSISKSPRALLEDHVTNDLESGTQDNWDNTNEPLSGASTSKATGSKDAHLMPTSQMLCDVRKEREKPPTNNSFEQNRSASLIREQILSASAMPPSPTHSSSSPRGQAKLKHRSTSPEVISSTGSVVGSSSTKGFTQSLDYTTHTKSKSKTLNRASSIKNERIKTNGRRSRSNSAFQVPNWLRKKRASSSRSAESGRPLEPANSIEQLFEAFKRTATIQVDPLSKYIDRHWSEVCGESGCPQEVKKYREAVWDMFQSEAKYLTKFLQPLELVYKNFLEELHFHQILEVADVDKIFANVSELCELSSDVANNLFLLFDGRRGNKIAPVDELIKAFSMFGHKFNPVYQRFCVNYEKQQGFVRVLQQLPDFQTFQSMCRSHSVVGKNDLAALLIAPMQHQCRYQLKLDQVLKYTEVPSEKELLSSTIKAFVVSLKELEANINEHKRSAELLELQETLYWPSVTQLNPEAFVSDSLKEQLGRQPCCELLASKDRQLVNKGTVRLLDNKGRPSAELNAYLFTDILLLTEEHRPGKKEGLNQLAQYKVFGHPMFLAHMELFEVDSPKNTLTLVERTALQQRIKLYSLQTSSKDERTKWTSQLQRAQDLLRRRHQDNILESDV